jgi:peptidoglycan/LPS O-acetylase OafA/YrhL
METTYWFRFGHTLGAVGFAFVLIGLARYRDWWASRAWSVNWLQWMGQRSYTIYVWHALPFLLIMGLTGGEDAPLSMQLARLPFMAAATILLSVVVYNKVEMRVLKSKLRFTGDRYSKTAVLAAQADMEKTKDEIRKAEPEDFSSSTAPAGDSDQQPEPVVDLRSQPESTSATEKPT